jgi:transposase
VLPRRYDSDLTDAQWRLIEPLLPPPATAGRPEKHPRREIVNAILYVVRTGCAWRLLPREFPPWQTVFWYFKRWRADGSLDRLHDALRDRLRDADGRDPMVSAAIVDAQSVKGADTVGSATRGYDAGNHAGRVVMPGSPAAGAVAAGQPGVTSLMGPHNYRASRKASRWSGGRYRALLAVGGAVRARAASLSARSACK